MNLNKACLRSLSFVVVATAGFGVPALAAEESRSVSEVWKLEDAYWNYVKAGDVESYVRLWDEKFIGWPCDEPHPLRKTSIGDWVRKIREGHIKVDVDLTHEGAEDHGDTVVVYYRFTRVDTYPDGHVEGQGKVKKITHTWMRAGDTWQIVGGMCGDLSQAGK